MRLVVTGACGFIGSHLCEALLTRGDTVVGVDNLNDFYDPRLKEENGALLARHAGFSLVRGSILDERVLTNAFSARPDAVVHLAAWAGVRPSIERPALYVRENIDGTVAVMDALRAQPRVGGALPKLVFASSSSVYGTNAKVPFAETDPIARPVSPYAATKRAGELLAHTYHHLFRVDVTCLRFFTVYGPRQRPEMAIHKFARRMLDGLPVPRYGDGSARRDFTYITDVVHGVLAAIDRCAGFHIYNLGNSRTVTLTELIDKLAAALGVTPAVEALPDQPGDVPITYADITLAARDLDYRPDYPLERGLAEFAAWLKARS